MSVMRQLARVDPAIARDAARRFEAPAITREHLRLCGIAVPEA
jgi:hypothetical protein